ncbi:hypothetical protein [Tunturiibacter lichenicola]|uniref:hypothetical protein n=1 Tax=Tunturiibacter lichenicola TaxID=2051959 RepID=UPI0021B27E50|nr:hypothetical protein [Edaphobacter lichenicola]
MANGTCLKRFIPMKATCWNYSRHVVLESRKQMDERDVIHRPVIGRIVLTLMRTMMRVVNHLPLLRRLMQRKQMKLRKISAAGAIERQRAQMA